MSRILATHQILEELNGQPALVQALACSTTAAQSSLLGAGERLFLLNSSASASNVYILPGDSTAVATTANTPIELAPGQFVYICLRHTSTHLSAICAAGTATLKISRMR